MQRRQFLQVAAGGLAGGSVLGLLVPKPETPRLNLADFCAEYPIGQYRVDRPFVQSAGHGDSHIYATDGTACVRIASSFTEATEHGRLPRVATAPFWTAIDSRWRPWPSRNYGPTRWAALCPECRGRGRLGSGVIPCDHSNATYDEWGDVIECPQCNGTEYCGGAACAFCNATGSTQSHGVQVIGDQRVFSWQDARIRRLPGVEFARCRPVVCGDGGDIEPDNGPILFRFDGGEGVVMPVWRNRS